MGELSIKISIADRIYPLSIGIAEEESVRKAAKLIEEKIREYQENYSVRDKQDLLAMCVLQFATQVIDTQGKEMIKDNGVAEKLIEIDNIVTDYLADN